MYTTLDLKFARVASIDVFRAITMMFMIFVNDFYYDINVPHWLEHSDYGEDYLGFSDVIFPAFLFSVGLSIPFAIGKRIAKGESRLKIGFHILSRSIALIVMGIFDANYWRSFSPDMILSRSVFCILMIIGFFLVWNLYPKSIGWKKYLFIILQVLGVALLIFLAFIYRSEKGDTLGVYWWGILGRIGWVYFPCAILFLLVRKRTLLVMLIALFASIIIRMALPYGFIPENGDYIDIYFHSSRSFPYGYIPGDGAYHFYALAGIIVSLLCNRYGSTAKVKKLFSILIGSGVILLLIGIFAHQKWIISWLAHTPSWVFLSSGIVILIYILMYWLNDIKGKERWFNFIKPAGTSTLTCFLLPYIIYSIFKIFNVHFPDIIISDSLGLLKSLIFSFIIIWLAALLGKIHIKIKI